MIKNNTTAKNQKIWKGYSNGEQSNTKPIMHPKEIRRYLYYRNPTLHIFSSLPDITEIKLKANRIQQKEDNHWLDQLQCSCLRLPKCNQISDHTMFMCITSLTSNRFSTTPNCLSYLAQFPAVQPKAVPFQERLRVT